MSCIRMLLDNTRGKIACTTTLSIKITWMLAVSFPLVNEELNFLKFGDPLCIFVRCVVWKIMIYSGSSSQNWLC